MQVAAFGASAGDPNSKKGLQVRAGPDDGFLLISEAGKIDSNEEHPSKFAVGAWAYTRTFDSQTTTLTDADGNTVSKQASSSGIYFLADKNWTKSFSSFLRYGVASSATNTTQANLSGGFFYSGAFGRDTDSAGLAFTEVFPTGGYVQSQRNSGTELANHEMIYEATYRYGLGHGVVLQPTYQYVLHPGYSQTADPAHYGGLRFEVTF